jgi:hypothetical protein
VCGRTISREFRKCTKREVCALVETAAGKLLELLAGGTPALVGGGLPDLDLDRGRASHRVFADNITFSEIKGK